MDTEHQLTEGTTSAGALDGAEAPDGAAYGRRGGAGFLRLHGNVDIFEARAVHAAAAACLGDAGADPVTLDLTDARRLDLSAMQVLAALRRDLEAAHRALSLQAPAPLAAAMTRTGLIL